MIVDAYNAVISLNLETFFETFIPEPDQGFMFSNTRELIMFSDALTYDHSGSSYAYVCRYMQSYFKNPENFKNMFAKS